MYEIKVIKEKVTGYGDASLVMLAMFLLVIVTHFIPQTFALFAIVTGVGLITELVYFLYNLIIYIRISREYK